MLLHEMKRYLLLLATFGVSTVHAQEALPASGGNASGQGGSASFTIGQVTYATVGNEHGSIGQGVQFPYEIVITGGEDLNDIQLEMIVFPNPTISSINLKLENRDLKNISYQLTDFKGRLLNQANVKEEVTEIPMEEKSTGTYILIVSDKKKTLKTFKIIKNN